MKYGLLVLLYLYFARVMHTVWVELRPTGKLRATEESRGKRGARRSSTHSHAATATAGSAASGHSDERRQNGHSTKQRAAKHAAGSPPRSHGGPSMVVVEPKNLAGMSYPISGRELTIGRAPGCGITVDDSYVSSLHARLARSNSQTIVEDLGSRNGTWVNEKQINSATVLKSGDRVRVGSVIMELR